MQAYNFDTWTSRAKSRAFVNRTEILRNVEANGDDFDEANIARFLNDVFDSAWESMEWDAYDAYEDLRFHENLCGCRCTRYTCARSRALYDAWQARESLYWMARDAGGYTTG